jgi:hypothetical protein
MPAGRFTRAICFPARERFVAEEAYRAGVHQQVPRLNATAARTNVYTPRLQVGLWRPIEGFVRSAVDDCDGLTAYSARELYAAVTPLTVWAWRLAALPLEREVIFAAHTIDRFTNEGLPQYTRAGRRTIRSRLRRVSEALVPELEDAARERAYGRSEPNKPYQDREIVALHSWAHALPDRRGVNARRLLALGLGAGLLGGEIGRVQVRDVLPVDGILIRVDGRRERIVPVLKEYGGVLLDARLTEAPESYLFRDGRDTQNPNLVTDFVARHPPPVQMQARRMRATWIVHHLNAGAPLIPLLAASGLQNAEGLDRFLRFAGPLTVEASQHLR